MSSPFKTPEFKKLFKEWNKILEKEGVPEIEDFELEEPLLKTWELSRWTSFDPIRNEALLIYYQMAEELLLTYRFENKTHRKIWEFHTKGLSPRKIEKLIHRKKYSKSSIYNIISEIELKSGILNGSDKSNHKKAGS